MTNIESMYLQDSRVKRAFFEDNAAVIDTSDLAKEDVAFYLTLLIVFETRIAEEKAFEATTGADQKTLKVKITDNVLSVQDKLLAYAIKTGDEALKATTQNAATSFTIAKNDDFIEKVKSEIARMKKYPDVLTKYGVTETFQQELTDDLADFEKIKPNMAVDRSKSAVITKNVHDAYAKLKEFTDKSLPVGLATLASAHPDFTNGYNRLATTSATIQGIKFKIKVVNAVTKKAEADVTIDIPDLELQVTTDSNGIAFIKTGIITDVTVKVSKESFNSQEIVVKKLRRGSVREIIVKLESTEKTFFAVKKGNSSKKKK